MAWNKQPYYAVCIAKPLSTGKRQFTEVGVAWVGESGGIKISIDITVILGPTDEVFLFPKDRKQEDNKQRVEA